MTSRSGVLTSYAISFRFYKALLVSAGFCRVCSSFEPTDQVGAPLSARTKKKPADALPETAAGHARGSILFASDFRFARRDRQHDPEAERNNEPNHDPRGRDVSQRATVPERRERTDHQDEVPNQISVDESHGGSVPASIF